MKRALDMFTLNEIKKGHDVWIHQEDGSRKAKVVDVFLDRPTLNQKGFWVDVDDGDGVEGIMSYIIEAI
jgi:hypothetical protein